jgi:hypothetical protein
MDSFRKIALAEVSGLAIGRLAKTMDKRLEN